ncbi:hypothetical protein EOD41_04700 [Mucilaginibacter limnophilus]|uniref:Uncharacterized protein n=1 Tax=Mucilaginibacter limnophilus TaxID=1932778 RepID=A0A3S3THN9_9SPHI|nr:hypothetical protein [Mucilaginibacter limnophilus]RVU01270.1 hypothetical protein EOD41_04700 [Mucilaginibacter limnophilus]
MKYNPITQQLFTNTGAFLKELYCPLAKTWEQLEPTSNAQAKLCSTCNQAVYDTAKLSDTKVQAMLQNATETCLKVDLNQENLTITHETYRRK